MSEEIKKEEIPADLESIDIKIGDKEIKGRWYRLAGFLIITAIVTAALVGFLVMMIKTTGLQFDAFGVKLNK